MHTSFRETVILWEVSIVLSSLCWRCLMCLASFTQWVSGPSFCSKFSRFAPEQVPSPVQNLPPGLWSPIAVGPSPFLPGCADIVTVCPDGVDASVNTPRPRSRRLLLFIPPPPQTVLTQPLAPHAKFSHSYPFSQYLRLQSSDHQVAFYQAHFARHFIRRSFIRRSFSRPIRAQRLAFRMYTLCGPRDVGGCSG